MSIIELAPNRFVGQNHPTFVIAEAGINHQGEVSIAKELIQTAKECGADCVKFQKRTVERILTREGLEKPYVNRNSFGNTYGEHKRYLEFSFDQFRELKNYADSLNILFTASGWDEESVDFLDSIGVPFFKIASADLTNFPLLQHTARKGKPIIISTGMADMTTVQRAYDAVSHINPNIVIMQCTSTYPASFEDIHLNVIHTYKKEFPNAVIGYSGHEKGIAVSVAAVAIGAKVIEKHFTLDRTMKGGDHAASLEPDGLRRVIRDIRATEKALGSFDKKLQESEKACKQKLTKSIVSICPIPKGTEITSQMLTVKGPGNGFAPMDENLVIGTFAQIDIPEDAVILPEWIY